MRESRPPGSVRGCPAMGIPTAMRLFRRSAEALQLFKYQLLAYSLTANHQSFRNTLHRRLVSTRCLSGRSDAIHLLLRILHYSLWSLPAH